MSYETNRVDIFSYKKYSLFNEKCILITDNKLLALLTSENWAVDVNEVSRDEFSKKNVECIFEKSNNAVLYLDGDNETILSTRLFESLLIHYARVNEFELNKNLVIDIDATIFESIDFEAIFKCFLGNLLIIHNQSATNPILFEAESIDKYKCEKFNKKQREEAVNKVIEIYKNKVRQQDLIIQDLKEESKYQLLNEINKLDKEVLFKEPLTKEVIRSFIDGESTTSASAIQRKFSVGYNKASRIIDELKELDVVTEPLPGGKRAILQEGIENVLKQIGEFENQKKLRLTELERELKKKNLML